MKTCLCEKVTPCKRCKNQCEDYKEYIREKELKCLMQGNDRQPMKRHNGALKRMKQ